jgi:glycosyltransferase involved in cell wall biosynthesis
MARGWRQLHDPGPGFDTAWYLAINADVAAAHVNPLAHYLRFGRREGRRPHSRSGFPGQAETSPPAALASEPARVSRGGVSTEALLNAEGARLRAAHPYLRYLVDQHRHAVHVAGRAAIAQVSVVITCRNKARSLGVVMERLGQQECRPDTVILVDDGSDDGSVEVFLEAGARAGLTCRASVLPPGGRFRVNTVRNRGFEMAPEGLVLLLDGDMLVSPVYVRRHLALHRAARAPIVSVGPRFEYAFPDGTGPVNFMWGHGAEGQSLGAEPLVPGWAHGHGAFGVRRAVWEAIGRFDPRYDGAYGMDDLDLLFRLFLCGVYQHSDFEAYVIHVPHETIFAGGHRDAALNQRRFCDKFGVPISVMDDVVSVKSLSERVSNWADDYRRFADAHRAPHLLAPHTR